MIIKDVSKHVRVDREDRVLKILLEVGTGEEVCHDIHVGDNGKPCKRVLTDTGIVICRDIKTDRVITMYPATFTKARVILNGKRMPKYLEKQIVKNQKIFEEKA